jgi:hypothetical protein
MTLEERNLGVEQRPVIVKPLPELKSEPLGCFEGRPPSVAHLDVKSIMQRVTIEKSSD